MFLNPYQNKIHNKIFKGTLFLSLFFVALALIFTSDTEAAINEEINYQARLLDNVGAAVADGSYSIEFNLYTVATSGSPIWTETQSATVTDGLFSVLLGSVSSLEAVNFNQTLYLGVNVEADGEMSPRKRLGAVPAAFEADRVDGIEAAQFFRNDITNSTSTATTSLSVYQAGSGNIAQFIGAGGVPTLTVTSGGNVGIGTTTPYAKLSVAGEIVGQIFTATSTVGTSTLPWLDTTNFAVSGMFYDSLNSQGTNGYVLQTSGSSVTWVATSSLGISATYGIGDPVVDGTEGSILFVDASGNLAQDNAGLSFDPATNYLNLGTSTDPVVIGNTWGNTRGAYAIDLQAYRTSLFQIASGNYSVAIGAGNSALGNNSTAIGYSNLATQNNGTAMGYDNSASSPYASAVGLGNTSSNSYASTFGASNQASGVYSTAVGYSNETSGQYSSIFGYMNGADTSLETTVVGISNTLANSDNTSIFGRNNSASNSASGMAILGNSNDGQGSAATVVGVENFVGGTFATGVGYGNTIASSADYVTLLGYSNQASNFNADRSVGIGFNNDVDSNQSIAVGISNDIVASDANFSMAFGNLNSIGDPPGGISSTYAGAFGYSNAIFGDYSYTFGYNNEVGLNVDSAFAIGLNLINNTANSVMIGPSQGNSLHILNSGEILAPYITATSTTATSTFPWLSANRLALSGMFYDSLGSSGANGYVLQSTGSGVQWVATSSLGIAGGSSLWTESGSDIYFNTGNVGIGTTSPTAKLAVVGDVVAEYFTATSTTATSSFAGGLNVGNGGFVYNHANGNVDISGALAVMTLGNVTDGEAPALQFSTNSGSGSIGTIYFGDQTANNLAYMQVDTSNPNITFGFSGFDQLTVGNDAVTVADALSATSMKTGDGSVGSPAYSFSTDTDTGMWRDTFGELVFSTGGNEGLRIGSVGAEFPGNVSMDSFTATSTTATSTIAGNLRVDNVLQVGTGTLTLTSDRIVSSSAMKLQSASALFTLPTTVGVAGQVLQSDGTGNLIWADFSFDSLSVGAITAYASSTPPDGWLWADGSAVSRTTYADLFEVVGTTYGVGDGSTTFNLPDLRGRVIAGMDNMDNTVGTGGGDAGRLTSGSKAGVDGDTIGASGGVEEHLLTWEESGLKPHSHGYVDRYRDSISNRQPGSNNTNAGALTSVSTNTSDNAAEDADEAHTNVQPTLVLGYIIRVETQDGGSSNSWLSNGSGDLYYNNGNIGIGTSTPAAQLTIATDAFFPSEADGLYIEGRTGYRALYMDGTTMNFSGGSGNTATLNAAGEWTNASDISIKSNIENLDYGLETLLSIQPRRYDVNGGGGSIHTFGFVAQEIENILPEVVHGEDGSKGVSYGNITAVTINAIKEIAAKINLLDAPTSTPSIAINNTGDVSVANKFNVSGAASVGELKIGSSTVLSATGLYLPATASTTFAGDITVGDTLHIGTASLTDSTLVASNGFSINADAFTIDGDGTIGIGTTTPQRKLHVYNNTAGAVARFEDANGYCEIDPSNMSLVCTSDESLKENVQELTVVDELDRLQQLRAVSFEWNNDTSDTVRYGFIAQEVEKIMPELVRTDEETGKKSVAYGGFVPFIVAAIQELIERVDVIQTNLAALQDQVKELAQEKTKRVFGWMQYKNDDLCVDDVCITREEFKDMLRDGGGTNREYHELGNTPYGNDTDNLAEDAGDGTKYSLEGDGLSSTGSTTPVASDPVVDAAVASEDTTEAGSVAVEQDDPVTLDGDTVVAEQPEDTANVADESDTATADASEDAIVEETEEPAEEVSAAEPVEATSVN